MAGIVRRRQTHPEFLDLFGWPWSPEGRALTERLFRVREDLIRVEEFTDGDTQVIRAELPGVDPSRDIEVTVTDGMLALHVERREETREKVGDGYRSEFCYGTLSRTVPLPAGAREEDVSATYNDGILEVRIPVITAAEKPATRRVEVKHA
jgi:HSP20 family protein